MTHMERLLAAAALVPAGIVLASESLAELGGVAEDVLRPVTIGAAMIVAYRVTAAAHRESSTAYREMAADAEARADAAEERLRVYQELADTRLRVLQDEIDRLRREIE